MFNIIGYWYPISMLNAEIHKINNQFLQVACVKYKTIALKKLLNDFFQSIFQNVCYS